MKNSKLSIAAIFLFASMGSISAQQEHHDSVTKEKRIDEVIIQSSGTKKTETAVLAEQKRATVQKQMVSAEEIARKGISNVEQGLTKVAGITSVTGKGLFVRGLEERYNYLLINGLGSPSNNPFQKIIALKQFPTDVVGKLNIYKTFSTNLYGDFAGATFDIETLTIDKSFSKVEFGVGVNTLSSFKNNFKIAENASGIKGYLGLNAQDRRLPVEIRNKRPSNYIFNAEQSFSSFKDSWDVDNITSLPNTSLGFTTVQKINVNNGGNLGILFSLNQASQYTYREGLNNQIVGNGTEVVYSNELLQKEYKYDLESSVLLGLGYKTKKTKIDLNAIFLQNSSNLIQDNVGYKNFEVQNKGLSFFRTNQQDISKFLDLQLLASQQLHERHFIKGGISYVLNNFSQPDRKIMEGNRRGQDGSILPDNQLLLNYGGNNLVRQYLDVNSRFYGSAFAEYSMNLGQKIDTKNYPLTITLGYNGFADARKTTYRFLYGRPNSQEFEHRNVIINIDQPDEVFNQSIKDGYLRYEEGSDISQYLSNIYQFVNAGYVHANYKPNNSWDILVGARLENDKSIIRYYEPSASIPENITKNRNLFLPSISIKKSINNRHNLRAAFSKTITRPILIETMPITYINPDNTSIYGNENITSSDNYNIDFKWEYFPTNKEIFAANLFAKKIINPIERSILASGNATGVTETFFNAKEAQIIGIEIEGVLNLGRLSEKLDNLTLGTNATFMYSEVKRSEEQLKTELLQGMHTSELRKRSLQGAAPYTINADLKYQRKNNKNYLTTISLIYNVSGKKVYAVGGNGTDNYYELPFQQLDFVINKQINNHWEIKLAVRNILNSQYQLELGDQSYLPAPASLQVRNHYRGTDFNASISYTF